MTYIKGYKVTAIHGTREQDPNNIDFFFIVEIFPRDPYLYVAAGHDLNGNYSLVVVLADGNNKSERGVAHARVRFERRRRNYDCRRLEETLD